MRTMIRGVAALIAGAAGLQAIEACGDSTDPQPTPVAPAVARATPSGDAQTGAAGQALGNPIRVVVTREGQPEAGIAVTWATSGPGATVVPATGTTDAQGIASTIWTLTQTAGATAASATVPGATGSPVGFTATATAGPAAQLTLAGGNNQTAEPGEALAAPLQVKVADQFGNAVAGVQVDWAVTAGGGSIAPPASTTSATGIAASAFTLGSAEGPNAAQATSAGLAGSPVIFAATAAVAVPGTGVEVSNNEFTPAVRTVPAGTTVVWTWTGTGAVSHSVRSTGTPSFPSSAILTGSGMTYSHQFSVPGTYTYDCEVHGAAMQGSIVVQ
jgi:plastocyanin